jgi:nitrate/nitrite-specific signal transduction histidine kinase
MTRVASRLSLSFLTYVLLLVCVVSATVFVLRRQHDDGLLVNLSGRQRMLTQRMTHQLLTYSSKLDHGADAHDAAERVHRTMRVFETTLNALSYGGPAPIDLQMATFRDAPPASEVVRTQLFRVRALYARYQEGAVAVLKGSPLERASGIEVIVGSESDLLAEMDAAVSLLQREAEAKVTQLFFIQGVAVALALLLTFVLLRWVKDSVTEPLEKLRDAAEEMSMGNLHKAVPLTGSAELLSLGESLDRMRTSLCTLLDARARDPIRAELAEW